MLNIIKNSFNIVLKNYTIPLFFVLFLTLITFTTSKFGSMPTILALCTLSVLIVFVGAFFAGWYGMIKSAVLYSYQEKTKEEELKDIFSLKNEFLNYNKLSFHNKFHIIFRSSVNLFLKKINQTS